MASTIHVDIVSAEGEIYSGEASMVFAPGSQGELGIAPREFGDAEIVERCMLALINEGARILEEGIATRSADIDVIWCNGYGYPRHRGGPMFYADTLGPARVCERIGHYAQRLGPRYWQPAGLLERLARCGGSVGGWTPESPPRSVAAGPEERA